MIKLTNKLYYIENMNELFEVVRDDARVLLLRPDCSSSIVSGLGNTTILYDEMVTLFEEESTAFIAYYDSIVHKYPNSIHMDIRTKTDDVLLHPDPFHLTKDIYWLHKPMHIYNEYIVNGTFTVLYPDFTTIVDHKGDIIQPLSTISPEHFPISNVVDYFYDPEYLFVGGRNGALRNMTNCVVNEEAI